MKGGAGWNEARQKGVLDSMRCALLLTHDKLGFLCCEL